MSRAPTHTLFELAERFGVGFVGDGSMQVTGVNTLAQANANELSFFANPKYGQALAESAAGVVVLKPEHQGMTKAAALLSDEPYVLFAKIAALFVPQADRQFGETNHHPSAVVHPTASVHPEARLAPHVTIGAHSTVGAQAEIGAGSVIGERCHVGAHSRLVARVTLVQDVHLGERVLIHPGAVLGADGFGLARDADGWIKVPQLGGVRVGNDCEIGANTTIDRATLGDTVLEHDVRLDNQIQIGHNVHIGAHTAMAGCSAAAGSAKIGKNCLIGGGAGILGHLEVCDGVTVTAMSLVTHSIHEPGTYSSGTALQPNAEWKRNAARLARLDKWTRQQRKKN